MTKLILSFNDVETIKIALMNMQTLSETDQEKRIIQNIINKLPHQEDEIEQMLKEINIYEY